LVVRKKILSAWQDGKDGPRFRILATPRAMLTLKPDANAISTFSQALFTTDAFQTAFKCILYDATGCVASIRAGRQVHRTVWPDMTALDLVIEPPEHRGRRPPFAYEV
jgi:hypothetical protein